MATLTRTPTATRPGKPPLLRLSEVLPAPQAVDWDGDGKADVNDEWIELVNAGTRPVNLGGWVIDLGPGGGPIYRIPRGTVLRAGAYLLLPRKTTGLALIDSGGQVRLLDARRQVTDSVTYPVLGPDASYSRDAAGVWHIEYPPSPGGPNGSAPRVGATATPTSAP
jgi:hypothetical protein